MEGETLLLLTEARRFMPGRPAVEQLVRWAQQGRLPTVIGSDGEMLIAAGELARFVAGLPIRKRRGQRRRGRWYQWRRKNGGRG